MIWNVDFLIVAGFVSGMTHACASASNTPADHVPHERDRGQLTPRLHRYFSQEQPIKQAACTCSLLQQRGKILS
jgi:hypothetical protein